MLVRRDEDGLRTERGQHEAQRAMPLSGCLALVETGQSASGQAHVVTGLMAHNGASCLAPVQLQRSMQES